MSQARQTRHFALALVSIALRATCRVCHAWLIKRLLCRLYRLLTVYPWDGPADKAMIIWANFY